VSAYIYMGTVPHRMRQADMVNCCFNYSHDNRYFLMQIPPQPAVPTSTRQLLVKVQVSAPVFRLIGIGSSIACYIHHLTQSCSRNLYESTDHTRMTCTHKCKSGKDVSPKCLGVNLLDYNLQRSSVLFAFRTCFSFRHT
jgi:hypothetical protein